ncbi:sortase [Patescibacteria group bacterium]|nr:sortase [Patescibacteria group bacterium]MBU1124041.1 sortase [Patescibacteria group bacterium]
MKNKYKYAILAIFATIVTLESFGLWTKIITGSVLSRFMVISEEVMWLPEHVNLHKSAESVVPETEGLALNLELSDNEPVDSPKPLSEPKKEDIKPNIENEKTTIVPTEMEPDIKEKSGLLDAIFNNQMEREMEQWGISEWYSLSIPSIGIRSTIYLPDRRYWDSKKWDLLEEQMQVGLLHGATAYPHSSTPGYTGSVIIAGHSSPPNERVSESAYGTLFASLPNIERGDKITIAGQGTIATYQVMRINVVDPADTQILSQQSDKSILKLITCFPIGTTKQRMVVIAERVE